MTVNELIEKLNKLAAEGNGEMNVTVYCPTAEEADWANDCRIVDPKKECECEEDEEDPEHMPYVGGCWPAEERTVCIM